MIASQSLLRGLASSLRPVFRSSRSELGGANIDVPELTSLRASGHSMVSACIDDQSIYFSSRDIALKPSAEALGSCLLLPALHAQRALNIHPEVCETWARQLSDIPSLVEPWWNYPRIELHLKPHRDLTDRCRSSALAFSCGVDSFYSLLRYPRRIDAIISVLGFDVKLRDRSRSNALAASVRAVAAEHAIQPIVLSTNLRQHRLMKQAPWERTHGGALAAIGHLLSDSHGTFVISSSVRRINNQPWGSRWDLDPKFGSAALVVEHFGEQTARSFKLLEIAEEPIVRKHLRVCWEYRKAGTNCGICEKCIRTMLTLDLGGHLGHFHTFRNISRLAQSIEDCPNIPESLLEVYELLLSLGLSHVYQEPVLRLMERSKAYHHAHA